MREGPASQCRKVTSLMSRWHVSLAIKTPPVSNMLVLDDGRFGLGGLVLTMAAIS